MGPTDFAKAFALGVLMLALNIALLFALGFVYAELIDPGHPAEYYTPIYPRIGNWSAPTAGIGMLFLAAWLFGRRRPARDALLFGAVVYVSYFAADTALGLASGPASQLLVPPFLIGLVGGALATYAGASMARR
jgi:hypothetical protein